MKETGLMFKAPLVRAILEGRKTQTRRVVNRLPLRVNHEANAMEVDVANIENGKFADRIPCPMGQPGDRIYVRETFVQGYKADPETGAVRDYDEEGNDIPMTTWFRATDTGLTWSDDGESEVNVPWKPATHMPKELARIWLEVTGVRVERLQDISEKDAIAEGIERTEDFFGCPCWRDYSEPEGPDASVCPDDPIGSFQTLWESTGGDWAANPWVWVVDFKVLSTTGRPA